MMLAIALAIAVVVTTGGWNPPGPRVPLRINVETAWLPPLMRPYALDAVRQWQVRMGPENLIIDPSEPRTIRFVYNELGSQLGHATFPWWSGYVSLIEINSDIYSEEPPFHPTYNIRRTMAHEFGHALGLIHVGDAGSLMYPHHDAARCAPSLADIMAASTFYRVRPTPGLACPEMELR